MSEASVLASMLESVTNVYAPAPAAAVGAGGALPVRIPQGDDPTTIIPANTCYFGGVKVWNLATSPAGAITVNVVIYDEPGGIGVEVYRAQFVFVGNNEQLSDVLEDPVPVWDNCVIDVWAAGGAHNVNVQTYMADGSMLKQIP